MNKLKKIALALIVAVVTSTSVNAQKIGHIRLDSLINAMPESKQAREKGTEYYNKLEEQVKIMSAELQSKYEEYQKQASAMSDLIKQTKEKELQDLQQRIQNFQAQAQEDLQKKNDELSKPIYEKANKAIATVAKENGYKYILDSSVGGVVYSEPTDDVTPLVMKKLGITASTKPAAAPAGK